MTKAVHADGNWNKLKCPQCGSGKTEVLDTRDSNRNSIRRRRECHGCGYRFTTYERIDIDFAGINPQSAV